ncbi:MAG: PDZ domain-containing protein [Verrucomicrobia bacterium]|nr:PDZ domain-containing protein [Verrucomicrobiota bacterium]
MDPLRARVSNIAFRCTCVGATDKIAEISVTGVAPDSGAEKAGLRAGDQLVAIDGVPVAGKARSDVVTQAGFVAVRGHEVTFTGHRGLLRRKWSLTATIDAHGKLEPKPPAPKPEPTPTPGR